MTIPQFGSGTVIKLYKIVYLIYFIWHFFIHIHNKFEVTYQFFPCEKSYLLCKLKRQDFFYNFFENWKLCFLWYRYGAGIGTGAGTGTETCQNSEPERILSKVETGTVKIVAVPQHCCQYICLPSCLSVLLSSRLFACLSSCLSVYWFA